MNFDLSRINTSLCYKLLSSLVLPRPIALISTVGTAGVVNVAPYSFFNLMGDDPPILIIHGDAHHADPGVRLGEPLHRGHLLLARAAPRRPLPAGNLRPLGSGGVLRPGVRCGRR